jgi:type I restriction enzyme M protein
MSEVQRRQLQQQLWNIANTLRGKMSADDFRDYILGFIFYKYLSEKIANFANYQLEAEGLSFEKLDAKKDAQYLDAIEEACKEELGYYLAPTELFDHVAKKGNGELGSNNFILGDLTKILKNIEQSTLGSESAEEFENLFDDIDLTSAKLGKSEDEKNDLIAKVLVHLNNIDFRLRDGAADVLGDAYEYLIGEFASGAGKKAGEFYTPQPVSQLLAEIVTLNNPKLRNVYDPTCGSGSLLLRVKRQAEFVGHIYGQEMNPTTYNLARMNMILHDVHFSKFDIKNEDTLEKPQHLGLKFDAIVANPPFSAKWSANPIFMSDDRFSSYGRLAPSSKADLAFVQHMVHHLSEEGTMAVVLPHAVLFRDGSEGHIRGHLVEKMNALDAVIGLPGNIFYGTDMETCVLVFKLCRKQKQDILFIDASKNYEQVKGKNVLLPAHIKRIMDVYKSREEEVNEFITSKLVSVELIHENQFNLNIPKYIISNEIQEHIDLDEISHSIKLINKNISELQQDLKSSFLELGINSPFADDGHHD